MELPIPEDWKKLWDTWDLRAFIILSLSLQTFLILFSPLRKQVASSFLTMPLWSAYLLADWAANFAVGLISNSQGNKSNSNDNNNDLLAFWAPFLLVHLGGPDTITAFSLEDNELWLRHLLGLVFQCAAALYIFFQSFPTKLWIPTFLMFSAGIIKYSERTRSLYLASLDSFRESMLTEPDPGPNYAKLMDEYHSKKEAKLPTRIEMIAEPDRGTKAVNKVKEGNLTHVEVVHYAYRFFKTFKGLIVDLIFSFRERNLSREFFLKRNAKDAFEVIEVELNFIYEVLFTKFSVVHCGLGYFCRFLSFSSVWVALVLFYRENKKGYKDFDIGITYILLLGAIALDIMAALMLIFSDWTIIAWKKLPEDNLNSEPENKLNDYHTEKETTMYSPGCIGWFRRVLQRRWCESISTYNLIYYCLHPRKEVKEKLIGYLGLTNFLDNQKYVRSEPFTESLRDQIFQELLTKSEMAEDLETAKEICASRGDWVLRVEGHSKLLAYVVDVDYDESLLLWHVATDLCYYDESGSGNEHRDIAKLLSDYMLYLLVMQPTMMSAVAGIGQIRFRDTCAEAKKFFGKATLVRGQKEPNVFIVVLYVVYSFMKYILSCLLLILLFILLILVFIPALIVFATVLIILAVRECFDGKKAELGQKVKQACQRLSSLMDYFGLKKPSREKAQIEVCTKILSVNTEVKPVTVKGDRSKSVLFDGSILAQELKNIEEKERWKIMSKVWIELLSYAASHCRARNHAQQLSRGGDLITLVWLLMAHFGLGDQFQINEGHARAKLIVGK